jgi:hypothetical protein
MNMYKAAAYGKLINAARAAGRAANPGVRAVASLKPTNPGVRAAASLKPATIAVGRPKLTMEQVKRSFGDAIRRAMINGTEKYTSMYPYMAMGPDALKMATTARLGSTLFSKLVNKFR